MLQNTTMIRSLFKMTFIFSLLISCSEDDPIRPTLINIVEELPGTNCPAGGTKIETGVDKNGNGELSTDEVLQTKYICKPGATLVVITDELPGTNCPGGGTKIETGVDSDNNNVLTANEISQTKYICKSGDDKQVRLEIPASLSTQSQTYILSEFESNHLMKFNKLNYANVESIIFVPSIFAGVDMMNPSIGTTCFVQLYNVTDNVPISNSELQSSVNGYVFKESGNIYNDLPSKEITLGVRIKSAGNLFVQTNKSYLFINKK